MDYELSISRVGDQVYFKIESSLPFSGEYRTNAFGQGIWKWDDPIDTWSQYYGTYDFTVQHCKEYQASVKVRELVKSWVDYYDRKALDA